MLKISEKNDSRKERNICDLCTFFYHLSHAIMNIITYTCTVFTTPTTICPFMYWSVAFTIKFVSVPDTLELKRKKEQLSVELSSNVTILEERTNVIPRLSP